MEKLHFNHIIILLNLVYLDKYYDLVEDIDITMEDDFTNKATIYLKSDTTNYCEYCGSYNYIKRGSYTYHYLHTVNGINPLKLDVVVPKKQCKNCGHIYIDDSPILADNRYTREYIIQLLEFMSVDNHTYAQGVKAFQCDEKTLKSLIERNVTIKTPKLPLYLGLDEKHLYSERSKTGGRAKPVFFTVFADIDDFRLTDVTSFTTKEDLIPYIKNTYPIEQRERVKACTFDMSNVYRDVAKECFPNAVLAIDFFHIMEHINRVIRSAVNRVKAKLYSKKEYKFFHLKEHHYYTMLAQHGELLTMNEDKIGAKYEIKNLDYNGNIVKGMKADWSGVELMKYLRNIDPELDKLREIRNRFQSFRDCNYYKLAKAELGENASYSDIHAREQRLIRKAIVGDIYPILLKSNNPDLIAFANTLSNFEDEICNSFIRYKRVTNRNINPKVKYVKLNNSVTERINECIAYVEKSFKVPCKNFQSFKILLILKVNHDSIIYKIKHNIKIK